MFSGISEIIVNHVCAKGIIKHEDKEETVYGLNTFLTLIVNVISALIIGFLFRMPIEIILFILVYKSLRKYIGGSHSDTALECYIFSCVIYIIVLICIKYYALSSSVTTIFVCCSMICMWIIAPVEAKKKPLDETEYKVFRRRSHISIIVWLCIFLILHYIPENYTYYYSNIAAVSIYAVALFAIIGKIQSVLRKKSPSSH